MQLMISTDTKRQVIDITDDVARQVSQDDKALQVFVLHTTAAITTADLDPGTDLDLLDALDSIIPDRIWRHPHDPSHATDHLLASIVGPSVTVPVEKGKLVLGTWQRIVLIEFDGPRKRNIVVKSL
jgi:secondary thiamine-phosphate synthase enzyme